MGITVTIKIGEKSIDLTMAEVAELHSLLDKMFVKDAPNPIPYPYPIYPPVFWQIKRDHPWEIKYRDGSAVDPNMHLYGTITSKAAGDNV